MDFKIALQLFTVREDIKADFEGTIKRVKELGYEGVEFAGLYGKSAKEVKAICEKVGITPISAHVPFTDLMANPDLIGDYVEIGCKFVAIPYLDEDYRPGKEKFAEVISGAKMLGEKAKTLGMKLAYHNHDFEFEKIDGEYALDILYREVPSDLLETELDTCWVNVGGENPVKYIEKYSGRVNILHLKDFVGCKSENMYALIGIDENELKDTGGRFEFRPVGKGVQNFPAILSAAEKCGTEWIVVEQDSPSLSLTALQCAEESIKYLKNIL